MREAVRSLDSQLPVNFKTLHQVFASSLDQRRFSLVIFGVFGCVALLLAALGIYGVTNYSVTQRTQEIGIPLYAYWVPIFIGTGLSIVAAAAVFWTRLQLRASKDEI